MAGLEDQLSAVLNNPQMMQQIMAMAQSFSPPPQESPPPPTAPPPTPEPSPPAFDPAMLQKIAGLAQQGAIDPHQQNLLQALDPYLSQGRLYKLERAMRAAKMAKVASSFIGAGGLQMLSGR